MIAGALKEVGSGAHPKDYFSVYCLGARESPEGSTVEGNAPAAKIAGQLEKSRRFMIYGTFTTLHRYTSVLGLYACVGVGGAYTHACPRSCTCYIRLYVVCGCLDALHVCVMI